MPMTKQQLLCILDDYRDHEEIKIMISQGQLDNISSGDNDPVKYGDKKLYCLELDGENAFSFPSLALAVDCCDVTADEFYDTLIFSSVPAASPTDERCGLLWPAQRLHCHGF